MNKLLIVLTVILVGCFSSNEDATSTLRKAGYTDIKTTGLRPLSCGENDISRTGFTAKNPLGQEVDGVVCCGVFKSCTIRF